MCYPFHFPSVKNGVMYAMMKPRLLRIAQVMIIRLSHALDSSTVLPFLDCDRCCNNGRNRRYEQNLAIHIFHDFRSFFPYRGCGKSGILR